MTTDPSSTGHVNSKIEDKQPLDHKKHQLRMGPAPFASFEDLSDEVRSQRLESPEDKQQYLIRLPGIHEDTTPGGSAPDISDNGGEIRTGGISLIGASAAVPSSSLNIPQEPPAGAKLIPCTPRIDISRASSSSHHEDSKDSTPENQAITALGVGFKEEGALELRSSTEELDFQDNTDAPKSAAKSRPTSPLVFVYDTNFDRQRKDSQTSEICLLSISGRTSRLSSIGSQCSDQSRISTTSHLSVMSGQSGASRSTSPHKMLLETSFCGSKPNLSEIAQGITEPKDGEILEKVLLSRKHDPTEAILAEGITIETPKTAPTQSIKPVKRTSKNPVSKPARTSISKSKPLSDSSKPQESSKEPTSKPTTFTTVPTISVGDTSVPTYVTPEGEKLTPGQVIKSQAGVEYTFIPLKGPLPKDFNKPNSVPVQRRSREPTKTLTSTSAHPSVSRGKKLSQSQPPPQSHSHQQQREPEYIRIKLKPDYMYNEDGSSKSSSDTITEKPTTLDLSYREKPSTSRTASTFAEINKIQSYSASPSSVPKNIHSSLVDQSPAVQSNASPSLSRRSSLFRSRETISPDSSTPTSTHKRKSLFTTKLKEAGESLKERTRTRSKSREREWSPALSSNESIDGKMHKQKTSVFSIFKPKKTPTKSKPNSTKSSAENLQYDGITNVEFTFDSFNRPKSKYHEQLLEGDSIRIPLHSPSEYENRTIASAVDNTEQSISAEADKRKSIETQESDEKCSVPSTPPERTLKHNTSTSSENVVFSTKLGSNEEIFTTKLPKKPIVFEKETSALMNEFAASIATSPPKEREVEIKKEQSEDKKKSSKIDEHKRSSFEEKKIHSKIKETAKESTESKKESKKDESFRSRKESAQEKKEVIKEFTEERREIKIESSKDKEKGKKETPDEEKVPLSDNKISSQRIEIITETVIKTETVTETTPTKTEQITITEKSNIEIKQSPKRDDSEQIPTPSETDNRSSVISTTEKEETSENSENDSEIEFINKKTAGLPVETKREEPDDQERKTLVFQTDSFEDELPYVPTTLPLERSVAVPIVPIKQRSTFEMKTRPIERPRSTTPINPSTIDDYCGDAALLRKRTAEKLKINLPREDTIEKIQKLKSPRKGTNPKAWQEFAEKGISSHQSTPSSGGSHHAPDSGDEIPPPLPPRSAPKEQIKQWINFEEIPEKHKPPKRIQTIPSRSHIEVPELSSSSAATSGTETVIYNYVNPEDCQCECHEAALKTPAVPPEEIEPLIQDDDSSDDTIKQSSSSSSQRTKR